MKTKICWYRIGVYREGKLLFPLREFKLEHTMTVQNMVENITAFIGRNVPVDEGDYIAWEPIGWAS